MAPKPQYNITENELRDLHHAQRMTPQEIADQYNCSRTLIYHYLNKFEISKLPKYQRLLSKRYGKLVVRKFLGLNKHRQAKWLCQCDCGQTTITTTGLLNNGLQSCGCFVKEQITTHGMTNTRPYRIWGGMKSRCDNPNAWNFHLYGQRGITYCQRWDTFENFWHDMKANYDPNKSLDRIDNDGNYCPQNCHWATIRQQNCNRSNSVMLTYKGKTQNITQWAEELKMSRCALYARKERGWSDKRILETPIQTRT